MKLRLFTRMLAGVALTFSTSVTLIQPSYAQTNDKFFCGMSGGVPATVVRATRGNIPMIRWVDTDFPPPWTPQRRCEEISARFQRFYDNGMLNFLKAGRLRGQPVLCVAASRGGPCLENGVVVTLKAGTDPQITLQRILNPRTRAAGGPIELSGGSNDSTISYSNGEAYLDMKAYLGEENAGGREQQISPNRPVWDQ